MTLGFVLPAISNAIEVQINKTLLSNNRYMVEKRYVNLMDTYDVSVSCNKGDELVSGGCFGPPWLPISGNGPSIGSLDSWMCTYTPVTNRETFGGGIAISAIQGEKRVEAYLSARVICKIH